MKTHDLTTDRATATLVHCFLPEGVAFGEPFRSLSAANGGGLFMLLRVSDLFGGAFVLSLFSFFLFSCVHP